MSESIIELLRNKTAVEEIVIKQWETDKYRLQEETLKNYVENHPYNSNEKEILIKATLLNSFYSTQIFDIYKVAQHISNDIQDIDLRLKEGDMGLVTDIAKVTMADGTIRNYYSFATKYCSFHNPKEYPIYDSRVELVLT